MKTHAPLMVCGKLDGEEKVPLEIAENLEDVLRIRREYRDVFGLNISFRYNTVSTKEYAEAKAKAWSKVFAALNGPITNVLTGLTTIP